MYFQIKHCTKIVKEFDKLRFKNKTKINNIKFIKGDVKGQFDIDFNNEFLKTFEDGSLWGHDRDYQIFRADITIPKTMENENVYIFIETSSVNGWNVAKNPQFELYINNHPTQGIDKFHTFAELTKSANVHEKISLAFEGFPGMKEGLSEFNIYLKVLDKKSDEFYYNLKVPTEVAELTDDENAKMEILKHLEKAMGIVDLRVPYSKIYYDSIDKANEYFKNEFYSKFCNVENKKVAGIGHTHIDVAWLWPIVETRQKVVRSFSTVLELMKQYPEYLFMSSQPQLYKYIKEEKPELFQEIKDRVKEGRWEAEGAMWLEADCNLASGESFVRQLIYGKRFFKEEFGVDNKILWLPDVFGYSAALPQILKKAGVDYFSTSKIGWNEYNKLPYSTFMWRGIDGTEILTHFITASTVSNKRQFGSATYNADLGADHTIGAYKAYLNKDINDTALMSFGWGDGGGGPTRKMLEEGRRLSEGIPGSPKFEMTHLSEFFNNLNNKVKDNKRLPKWVGELYLEYHRGTYTSMARNKKWNRQSELLYRDIEFFSTMASSYGLIDYPTEDLLEQWETILLNQFHDILPGSSIEEVYEDSKSDYHRILNKGNELLQSSLYALSEKIATKKMNLVVFNQLSFERDDTVEIKSNRYYSHAIASDGTKYCGKTIEGENNNTFIFSPILPQMGYESFHLIEEKEESSELSASMQCLENQYYNIAFDDNMNITSIFDKKDNRELVIKGEVANALLAYEDKPYAFDAWEVSIYYKDKVWPINDIEKVEIIDEGPVRVGLRIRRNFLSSVIEQVIYIYKDSRRIDFKTYMDWKESDIILKATFPIDLNVTKANYDIQFGNVERPTHWNTSWDYARFEVCAHKWADISEEGYGVSLLNDSKYGYDIKDSTMSLTLLKCSTSPNPNADKEEHEFTYSLLPHVGGFREGKTINESYKLNCPINHVLVEKGKGKIDSSNSFVTIDKENAIIEAIKQCEYDESTIIRIYESHNKTTKVRLSFDKIILNAYETNLLEEIENELVVDKNHIELNIKPYEIKTIKINFK